jgi:hypothetical protein
VVATNTNLVDELVPPARATPRRTHLTDVDGTQRRLFNLFALQRYAPAR